MRIGSLFSGIGGLELGLEWAGVGDTVWQVEHNPFCQSILKRHWPSAGRFEDVKKVGVHNLAPVDLICGGFPCQDVSSAGKGAGLDGSRSGLWFEFARIVGELRPRWVVVENVASGASRWVDRVVAGLESLDYETLPIPLSAQDVGAPHLRRRIFIVAHTDGRELRQQSRGRCGPVGESKALPSESCQAQEIADPEGDRRRIFIVAHANAHSESVSTIDAQTRELPDDARHVPARPVSAWPGLPGGVKPSVCRVDDGDPRRLDRLRSLGNAVVPQCAEVIGHVILLLQERQHHANS